MAWFKRKPITEWDLRAARDNAYTRALLRQVLHAKSSCVDIGAHRGVFLKQFLEFAPQGKHVAIEPIPDMAADLRAQFPDVDVLECALSESEGTATFHYVPQRPAWSGLRKQPYPKGAKAHEISVALRRLDDIIGKRKVDFVKIDVEGAELEALRGGQATLKRCRPVVLFECAKTHHTHYDTTAAALYDFFEDCGLAVHLMDQSPISRDAFIELYEAADASGYNRHAWANFLAMPV